MMERGIKRLLDIVLALIAIVFLMPLFIVIILLLLLQREQTVFFVQPRIGKGDKEFKLIKFKTMTERRDSNGDLLPDKERMTKIGRILRESSLDELPQLFNVLAGTMSLVGPRPLLVKYLPLYNSEQRRRHEVRPGITGLAQIMGRNTIRWEQRFRLDVWYVRHFSIYLDLFILCKTIGKTVRRESVNQNSETTMSEFKGNK